MKTKPAMPTPFVLLTASLLMVCQSVMGAEPPTVTLIAGKTVYKDMGMEDVEITARHEGKQSFSAKSGYHGSFLMHLPPGVYEVKATGLIRPGEAVQGKIERLDIKPGTTRIDRLVITLER